MKDFYATKNALEPRDYLAWFRDATEQAWRVHPQKPFEHYVERGVGGSDWQLGTIWHGGYSEQQIQSFENKWDIQFPPDYQLFLRLLGVPDQPKIGAKYSDDGLTPIETPSFHDWTSDDIGKLLNRPINNLLTEVESGSWLRQWGKCPVTPEERRATVSHLIDQAPPLIPIIGHRYLIGLPTESVNPVLSVYGSDIIIYAADLRGFLLVELAYLLNINRDRATENAMRNVDYDSIRDIPF